MQKFSIDSVRRVFAIAATVFGTGGLAGCSGGAASPPPATPTSATPASADDDVAVGLLEHHRHHHHGGVMLLIAMSIDTLGVSPEQQAAVEKIRTDLHARMEPARASEESLVTLLADGVAAGSIDAAKVDAALAQVTAAAATAHEASADALNQLHAVLTPSQRATLVDKVEAHWSVWQKANDDESAQAKPGGHLTQLTAELDLTPDEVSKIHANLAAGMKSAPHFDPQEVTAHIRAFGDAFRGDTFDAKALATGRDASAHMVGWGAGHRARFLQAVTPVLTPEQRAKLAQMLREHASHNPSAKGA
jgi:Spy/CpxP family protein refolding chaperone